LKNLSVVQISDKKIQCRHPSALHISGSLSFLDTGNYKVCYAILSQQKDLEIWLLNFGLGMILQYFFIINRTRESAATTVKLIVARWRVIMENHDHLASKIKGGNACCCRSINRIEDLVVMLREQRMTGCGGSCVIISRPCSCQGYQRGTLEEPDGALSPTCDRLIATSLLLLPCWLLRSQWPECTWIHPRVPS